MATRRQIHVSNRQDSLPCDAREIRRILRRVLRGGPARVELSVAVVGDREITRLNARFLGRRRRTDVIAFTYERSAERLEGEIIVNAEAALRQAKRAGHTAQDEMLLYVVHGALHLLGDDDARPADRARMHRRALALLAAAGRTLDPRTLLARPRRRISGAARP